MNLRSFFAEPKRRNVYIMRSEPLITRIYTDYRSMCLTLNLRHPRNRRLFFTISWLETGS
jgi:hypothetical protein